MLPALAISTARHSRGPVAGVNYCERAKSPVIPAPAELSTPWGGGSTQLLVVILVSPCFGPHPTESSEVEGEPDYGERVGRGVYSLK